MLVCVGQYVTRFAFAQRTIFTTNVHERHEEAHQRQKTADREHYERRRRQNGKVQHGCQRVHGRLVIFLNVFPERAALRRRLLLFVVVLVVVVPRRQSRHGHGVIQRAHLNNNACKK